jgi:hypothetical protein
MKLKERLRNLKFKLANLWFRYVKSPLYYGLIVNPRLEKERKAKIEKIKKEFEINQKASVDRVKEIMFHEKNRVKGEPKRDYHNEKLVDGRQHMINNHDLIKKIPFFYEPEICDIHNETIKDKKDALETIIKKSREHSAELLKKQEKALQPNSYKRSKNNF